MGSGTIPVPMNADERNGPNGSPTAGTAPPDRAGEHVRLMQSIIMNTNPSEHARTPLSFRLTRTVLSRLPHPLIYQAAMIGGFAHYLSASDKRRHYRRNTAPIAALRAHPIRPWRAFQNHALNILEMLKALSESPDRIVERVAFSGETHLDRALAAGTGLILATCHFGNWELSGIALSMRGYPITTVAGRQLREGWSEGVKRWKRDYGISVLSPGSGYRNLYRDLQNNRIVVLHIDGNLFSRGVEARFLGEMKSFPRGPGHLSRAMHAPIAFAYCRRSGRHRFDVTIEEPIAAPRSESDEIRVTAALIERMENCILAEPEQWCIFRGM